MTDVHEGGCVCGSVRYRITGDPIAATVCHCRFCQKRTGSAFSQPVFFKSDQVGFSGEPMKMYVHHSDESNRWLRMQFCSALRDNRSMDSGEAPRHDRHFRRHPGQSGLGDGAKAHVGALRAEGDGYPGRCPVLRDGRAVLGIVRFSIHSS